MFTFPVCKHPVEYRWFRYRLYIFTDISIAISNTIWGYLKFHSAKRREAAHHQHGTNQESNATCACFQNEQRSIWTSFSCGCKLLHDIFGGSGSHLSGCFGHIWSMNGALPFYGWRLSGGGTQILPAVIKFVTHSQAVGILKHPLVPEPLCEILTTYFLLFFISSYMKGRSYYVFLCSQWIIGEWLLCLSFS